VFEKAGREADGVDQDEGRRLGHGCGSVGGRTIEAFEEVGSHGSITWSERRWGSCSEGVRTVAMLGDVTAE
jgi:hypothetical protein